MATKFTYFGGMCILVERSDGYKILFDPYLSANPATKTTPDEVKDIAAGYRHAHRTQQSKRE